MKKFIIPAIFCLALTVGCAEKKAETETHTHEDGTTHEAHTEANPETVPAQEEFDATVTDTATSTAPVTEGEHKHADGEAHTH
ncbi:hypothetical protein [Adhaeribacter soli]|uniref:Uncharacterized protein n=1 Tax=Adhaeribacter soli TaxID=2607655 RepID=A0A5N1IX86_9BACT|nr:hypothetical protein [Adhaeribacter soli]KAA9338861.1 hypothetical protein F0P94_08690 [Adhaeribacter soli]